jgi:outer membrane protein
MRIKNKPASINNFFVAAVLLSSIMFFSSSYLYSQEQILNEYIEEALKSNTTLKQRQYSYEKSLEALNEAKRLFLPTISLEAYYVKTEGGRTMTLPLSETLNPVYDNLNLINQTLQQINPAYPTLPQYPSISDYTVKFIRETEQETKLQLKVPVFNSSLIYNHRIKSSLSEIERINVEVYKSELIKEVKTAYINFLCTVKILSMYKNTHSIVQENLKNMQKLFDNEKIAIDEVYSARANVKEIEKKITEAEKNKVMSCAYLNFLLNRDLNTEIIESKPYNIIEITYDLASLQFLALGKRDELKQLDELVNINDNQITLEKSKWLLPQISLGASYGFQGDKYVFNKENDIAQVGLSLSWNFFTSGQTSSKVEQACIEKLISEEKKSETESKIKMEVMEIFYSLKTALKGIELAKEEYENYYKTFSLIQKKHALGMSNHLEFSNALNNQLTAENKVILAEYEFYLNKIKLERAVGNTIQPINN